MASNYEVNIKLDTKQAKDQLRELEERIAKLNRLALKGKASKQILKTDRDALALKIKENRVQDQKIKKDRLELKIAKDNLRVQQQSVNITNRQAGGFNRGTGGGANRGGGGGVFSGALISGSFPLLFGQGPLGAAAGFGGGLIGGALGGQTGGFAGGLVATALLQTVTNTVNGINELGAALNDPTQNLDKLVTNLSRFDRNITTSVSILQSAGLTAAAGQFARARFGMQFGAGGADSLEEMNKAFKEFGKVTTRLGTELAILASGPLTGLMKMLNFVLGGGGTPKEGESLKDTIDRTLTERENAIKKITDLEASLQEKLKKRNELRAKFDTKEKQRELAQSGELGKTFTKFRRLGGEISAGQLDLGILKDQVKNFDDTLKLTELQKKILQENEMDLKAQLKIEKARFEGSEKNLIVLEQRNKLNKLDFAIEKQIAEVEAVKESGSKAELERAKQTLKNLELQKDLEEQITLNRLNAADPAISRMNELNKKMRELNDITQQAVNLSKAMGESFAESFKGIIKGTMSVQDAFRNMFMRIADHFLDMAAKMAATQLQRSLLGMFGSAFGGFSFGGSASAYSNAFKTSFDTSLLGFRDAVSATPILTPEQQVSRFTFGKAGLSNSSDLPSLDLSKPDNYNQIRFGFGKAMGGPVTGGTSYIVGERGPELFSPGVSGMITPNHALGGSTNVIVNVDASGSSVEGDEQQGRELGRLISVAVQSELVQQKRPGGLLA